MTTDTPPPGSDDAVALGCRCPIRDNGRGTGAYGGTVRVDGKPIYWQDSDCPLHGLGRLTPDDAA